MELSVGSVPFSIWQPKKWPVIDKLLLRLNVFIRIFCGINGFSCVTSWKHDSGTGSHYSPNYDTIITSDFSHPSTRNIPSIIGSIRWGASARVFFFFHHFLCFFQRSRFTLHSSYCSGGAHYTGKVKWDEYSNRRKSIYTRNLHTLAQNNAGVTIVCKRMINAPGKCAIKDTTWQLHDGKVFFLSATALFTVWEKQKKKRYTV